MIDNVCEGLPWWPRGKRLCLPTQELQEIRVQSLGQDDSLEEEMATHSSILPGQKGAWRAAVHGDSNSQTCAPGFPSSTEEKLG